MVYLASDESSYMARTELIIYGGKLTGKWHLADTLYGAGLGTVVTSQRSRIRGHTGCGMPGLLTNTGRILQRRISDDRQSATTCALI